MASLHFSALVASLVWIVIKLIVLVPLPSIYLYQYHKLSKNEFISRRRPNLAVLNGMAIIYYVGIHSTIYLVIEVFYPLLIDEIYSFMFNVAGLMLCFITFLARGWQIFFDLSYNEDIADRVWKSALDSKFESWFISHRSTIGKPRFILRVCIIIFIVIQIIMFLLGYFIGSVAQRLLLIVFSIGGVIVMMKILHKLDKFEDNIAIQGELTLQLKFGILGIVSMFITSILSIFLNTQRLFFSFIFSIVPCIILTCLLCISTVWVLYQLINNSQLNKRARKWQKKQLKKQQKQSENGNNKNNNNSVKTQTHDAGKVSRSRHGSMNSSIENSSHSPNIIFLTKLHAKIQNKVENDHKGQSKSKANRQENNNNGNNTSMPQTPSGVSVGSVGIGGDTSPVNGNSKVENVENAVNGMPDIGIVKSRSLSVDQSIGTQTQNDNLNDGDSFSDSFVDYGTVPLQHFLSNKRGFKIFLRLLVKEYAIENLIFLLEASLLKTELIELNCKLDDNYNFDNLLNNYVDIQFPKKINSKIRNI